MSTPYGSPSPLWRMLSFGLAMLVGGVGLLGTMAATGMVQMPWMSKMIPEKAKARPEGVPVLVTARTIPAYTQISRDHVLNEKTGELSVVYLPEASAQRGEFLALDRILGRVLKADKPAGYGFRERDFLPPGTHPGPAAGVPPGKRAVVVPADRLAGVNSLKIGDRIDIFMSMPTVPNNKTPEAVPSAAHPGQSAHAVRLRKPGLQALAQDAVVVVPVTTRQAPVLTAVTGRDGKFSTKPVQEITIAVAPDETAPLMQALAVDTELFCALRSGQPGDPPGDTPDLPSPPPPPPPLQVETIVGGKREIKVFQPQDRPRP